ncbi:hypothetical protein HDF16_004549 [Granulicella aggregans]|uniref:Uncharacterized protein n=1 Tax=Granulicella aggregans TaxID=474949 RepID=A0A7W7ZH47_9BACT|nr:hypothetical protein [Granulicella aggregans]
MELPYQRFNDIRTLSVGWMKLSIVYSEQKR